MTSTPETPGRCGISYPRTTGEPHKTNVRVEGRNPDWQSFGPARTDVWSGQRASLPTCGRSGKSNTCFQNEIYPPIAARPTAHAGESLQRMFCNSAGELNQ